MYEYIRTKREAIAAVRSEANFLIECAERRAQGWDRGMYRDDDTTRTRTLSQIRRESSAAAFAIACRFEPAPQRERAARDDELQQTGAVAINRELKKRGIAERITQGRGYCYFRDGNAHCWFSSSIPVCYMSQLTIEDALFWHDALANDPMNG